MRRPTSNGGGPALLAAPLSVVTASPSPIALLPPADEHTRIERRAYELYLQRGEGEGDHLSDWLAAEREIKELA
jgi:hypothetical protein